MPARQKPGTGAYFSDYTSKETVMTRPQDPFEAISYDLNQFRERRMAERRAVPRNTADRRSASGAARAPAPESEANRDASGTTH